MTIQETASQWQLRLASLDEIDEWDILITSNFDGGNFLQTRAQAAHKQASGWTPLYLIYEKDDRRVAALAFQRNVLLLGAVWYFPKGPGISIEEFDAIYDATLRFIHEKHLRVFLVQMEPEWIKGEFASTRFVEVVDGIQAYTSTVVIPLAVTENALFASFSERVRRGIRRGEKEDVDVRLVDAGEENLKTMYSLMKTVSGGRGAAGIRPYDYYRRFWQTYMAFGLGALYFGFESNKPVVGAFMIRIGKKAFYKDGGSDHLRLSKGASYVLQWRIMQDMKRIGVVTYDMVGAPPSERRNDVTHYLHGVGLFKAGFHKEIIDYCGVINMPISRWKYGMWKYYYPLLSRILRYNKRYFY